jgi:hypothetical protein
MSTTTGRWAHHLHGLTADATPPLWGLPHRPRTRRRGPFALALVGLVLLGVATDEPTRAEAPPVTTADAGA